MTPGNVFITGGASGLGQALAKQYGRAGWRVCIGDLSVERCDETMRALEALGATAHAIACDVTREPDLESAARWMDEHWGGADMIINNAGVAQVGPLKDVTLKDWRWIIEINMLGVVRGCKVFIPRFEEQGHGAILNIASMAGLTHMPRSASYNATKSAVIAISETLELELDPSIQVSVACPAFFRTNLTESLRATDSRGEKMVNKLVGHARVGADEIAEKIFQGVERGDFHILTHPDSEKVWWLKRLLPHKLYLKALSTLQERAAKRRAGRSS